MHSLESFKYHKTITLLTGVFGAVFNEIKIERADGKIILVPISYAIQQKYDARLKQNPDIQTSLKYQNILPRMSFKLVSWQRDPDRMTSKYNQLIEQIDRTQVSELSSQRNRVPYKFMYEVNAKTKTVDDMLQIVEQLLVMFNPSLNVIVKDNKDLKATSAINITLLDSQIQDMFEGAFDDEQFLETSFSFALDGWLYMPTATSKIITKVITNIFDLDTSELLHTNIEVP